MASKRRGHGCATVVVVAVLLIVGAIASGASKHTSTSTFSPSPASVTASPAGSAAAGPTQGHPTKPGATPKPTGAPSPSPARPAPPSKSAAPKATAPKAAAPRKAAAPKPAQSHAARPPATAAKYAAALKLAAKLPVKGRAPKTGYVRAQFGDRWADTDHNGCDTRNDILRRDLKDARLRPDSRCVVASGTLHDPYTGKTIAFTRGQVTSQAVQIDHRVALADAWQKGAQQWSAAKRLEFANDPINLVAVDGPTNLAKGAGDAATWLPPNKAYRCDYVAAQVVVKARYGLWVTPAERDAIVRVLTPCAAR